MKVRLTKPLVQIGRIIPAGVVISDAPPEFMRKLIVSGKAEPVQIAPESHSESPYPVNECQPIPNAEQPGMASEASERGKRKKVKRDG